jgi:hypothetical protein
MEETGDHVIELAEDCYDIEDCYSLFRYRWVLTADGSQQRRSPSRDRDTTRNPGNICADTTWLSLCSNFRSQNDLGWML